MRKKLQKVKKFLKKKKCYILVMIIGALLTPPAIYAAFTFRGYKAIGGEFLLIPLFFLVVAVSDMVKNCIVKYREESVKYACEQHATHRQNS